MGRAWLSAETKDLSMKILAINGSYRGERGQTQRWIELLFKGAREAGAECESIALSALRMYHCLGCNTCQRTARITKSADSNPDPCPEYELACVYKDKDDVEMVFQKMRAADLIIYASPVYVFNISTLLKTLLDRIYGCSYVEGLRVTGSGLMFHHVDAALVSKPFVPLIVCDNLEDDTPRTLVTYFEVFARFMDAPMVGKLVRNGGVLMDQSGESQLPKILQVRAAYEQAGRELATAGRVSRASQRQANQEIVPVPLFRILKRIRWVPFKKKFVERANSMRSDTLSK
jgi:multimeric flavodoxin WrbA